MKLLVAGGCHVKIHDTKLIYSFSNFLLKLLEKEFSISEYRIISYANMTTISGHLNFLKDNKYDFIILQLGHYECPSNSLKRFKRMLKTYNKTKCPPISEDSNSNVGRSISFRNWTLIYLFKKLLYNMLVKREIKGKLVLMNPYLQPIGKKVIILSPFPTIDKTAKYYRKKGKEIFRKFALVNNYLFIDIEKAFTAYEKNLSLLFIDNFHLNKLGHEIVAETIMDTIRKNQSTYIRIAQNS